MTVILGAVLATISEPVRAQAQTSPDQKPVDVEVRVMFWGDASGAEAIPGQQERITDLFVRRARVVVQGRVSRSIALSLQLGQDNVGAKVLADDGSIRIKDAYLNYRPTNAIQIAVGQFKIPFLRANLESGFNQILVDRGTLPTLRPAREGSRDLGAMAWGNVEGLQYRLAVFDGSDQESGNRRSSVRLSSRVAYNWFTSETGLSYTGTYLGRVRVLQLAAQVDVQGARLDPRDDSNFQSLPRDYRAYALEAFFEQPLASGSAVTVEGARLDRNDDYSAPDIATRGLRGYYVQSAVLVPDRLGPGRLQLAVRREVWETVRGSAGRHTTRITLGATYYFSGHDRKLQTDFTRRRESRELENDEFRLSLVLVF